MIVIIVFMVINKVDLMFTVLWLPLILIEVYLFALGISLFLSAMFVKFRDIGYIWEVILQAGFYLTPILYPLSLIPNITFQKLILLNPMAQAIQDARWSSVTHQTLIADTVFQGGWYMYIPFLIVVITLIGGLLYFKKESKYFAENI
jgi:ABC-2 type transport system permease protein